ncbi:MAG: ABC-2 family transporter protein [Eubacteriales bacterium]
MKIKKYFTIFKISLRNALYYGKNFFGGVLMYILFIYVFFRLWGAIYTGDLIAGYTYKQIIWYVCITEIIAMAISTNKIYEMSEEIKNGAIAYQLGRPYNYILYLFSNVMGVSFLSIAIYFVIGFSFGTILVGLPPVYSIEAIVFFAASLLLGLVIQFFLMMSIGLTAFFVEENRPFFFIYQKFILLLGTFIPIEFFPAWMQTVLKYMPFAYITWGPAKIFVDFSFHHAISTLSIQLLWAAISITICFAIFKKGVKAVHVHGG